MKSPYLSFCSLPKVIKKGVELVANRHMKQYKTSLIPVPSPKRERGIRLDYGGLCLRVK
jgi:hypothetical protein